MIDSESVIQSCELLGAFEGIKGFSLMLGIAAIASGLFLFVNHRRHLNDVMSDPQNKRILAFEIRKYRRRTAISAMITSTGFMLAALNWVNEPRVFTVFIMMILGLLLAILVIAFFEVSYIHLVSRRRQCVLVAIESRGFDESLFHLYQSCLAQMGPCLWMLRIGEVVHRLC